MNYAFNIIKFLLI